MTQKKQPSLLGGAMIIAGTAIGAGMLANPTSTAGVWFIGSILALIYTWFCMTTSGLMILEANLHYPTGASFDTIVKDLLGKGWNLINGLSVAFVLYILTYAYITSGGGITQSLLNQFLRSPESAVEIPSVFNTPVNRVLNCSVPVLIIKPWFTKLVITAGETSNSLASLR